MLCTQAADNATDLIIVNIINNDQWFDIIIIMVNVYITGRCCIRVVRRSIYSCAPDIIDFCFQLFCSCMHGIQLYIYFVYNIPLYKANLYLFYSTLVLFERSKTCQEALASVSLKARFFNVVFPFKFCAPPSH